MQPHPAPPVLAMLDQIDRIRNTPRPTRVQHAIILDHAVASLAPAFQRRGLEVTVLPEPGLTHDARFLFACHVIVTTRSEWYLYDADSLGTGIVGLDLLGTPPDAHAAETIAQRILETLTDGRLWNDPEGWIALLTPDRGVRVVGLGRARGGDAAA